MKRFFSKLILLLTLGVISFSVFLPLTPLQAFDGDPVGPTNVRSDRRNVGLFGGVTVSCWEQGTCSVCDILIVMINITNVILRFFAVIALIFFIWGAGYLILSSGNEQMVTKGKGIIKATIIGSIIVLVAWQLIAYIALILANENLFADDNRVNNPIANWYNVAGSCTNK